MMGAVIIPGYLDGYEPPVEPSPLIDATAWAQEGVFWPGFLYTVGGLRSAGHAFDVDLGDLDVFVTKFLRRDRWPVFSLPLADGASAYVVGRNFEGDGEWTTSSLHPAPRRRFPWPRWKVTSVVQACPGRRRSRRQGNRMQTAGLTRPRGSGPRPGRQGGAPYLTNDLGVQGVVCSALPGSSVGGMAPIPGVRVLPPEAACRVRAAGLEGGST
jgi:hypothetical protein